MATSRTNVVFRMAYEAADCMLGDREVIGSRVSVFDSCTTLHNACRRQSVHAWATSRTTSVTSLGLLSQTNTRASAYEDL